MLLLLRQTPDNTMLQLLVANCPARLMVIRMLAWWQMNHIEIHAFDDGNAFDGVDVLSLPSKFHEHRERVCVRMSRVCVCVCV